MNFGERPPVILRLADRPPDDLDRMLSAFFRAELPRPWPKMSPPEPEQTIPLRPAPARRPVLRRRLAVAAAAACILIGYFALARTFPGTPQESPFQANPNEVIGKMDRPKSLVPHVLPPLGPDAEPVPEQIDRTPHGDAKSWGERSPDGRIRLQVEPVGKGPRR